MPSHFVPVGKPPPPRPRRPERAISARVPSGPSSWARATPRPPLSVARYSSREVMGVAGNRNVRDAMATPYPCPPMSVEEVGLVVDDLVEEGLEAEPAGETR